MQDRLKYRFWHKPTNKMIDCYGFNKDFVFGNTLDGIGTTYNPAKLEDCILMQCTGLKDKNCKLIYEGDKVIYYHEKKHLVPVTDKKPFEAPYGMDEESGLPLAYRTKKIIRYKGVVSVCPLTGVDINLGNRCHWWSGITKDNVLPKVEVIGNIYENPELLEVSNDH